MISRFSFAFLFLIATVLGVSAAGMKSYDAASFSKAVASGAPVVVHVHAGWCPTCKKQEPTLQSLSEDAAMSKAKFVRVDFDKDQDFLKAHKVSQQATILVFKNGKEVERLNGVTDAGTIQAKIKAAVG